GEIFDADIILNLAEFDFGRVTNTAACESGANATIFDLENTLVHEIGHFIGFDHVPDSDATMFASAQACETLKRDLAADDLDGLCTVYPAGAPPQTCSPAADYGNGGFLTRFRNQCETSEGCRCVGSTPSTPPLWLALLLLVPCFRRRRPQASPVGR
ncbi:MAG: matrixin family metalloprotease, partial [Myxococcota bacterium]